MIRFLQQDSRLTKFIFVSLITIVAIMMVIFLVPGIFQDTQAGSNNYATIHSDGLFGRAFGDTTSVPVTEVQQLAQRMMQQQHLPDFVLPFLMQRAGQALVQRAVMLREADRLGLSVTDQDLRNELRNGPFASVLFPKGQFIGETQYENFVQNAFSMSREDFETQIKEEILINRLQAMVAGGQTVSNDEVRAAYLKQATKVKFQYAVISTQSLRTQINPTDAELATFFKQNAERYANAVPATRQLQYAAFGLNQIPGGPVQISDAEVQQYYNQNLKQYQVPEQVRVRHILIKVAPNADAKTTAAARQKAEDILNQLHHGADFAALAKKYSDDQGSKPQGGELGFLQRGATVPEFDKTAFSLQPGQISNVIQTQFGYHILQVEARQPAHEKPLSEVHDTIVASLTQQKQGQAAQSYATQLQNEAQKVGLQKMADAHHLQVVTTDYLQQGAVVPGLADGSQMVTRAFTMTQGAPAQAASTGEGYAVFQVTGIKAAHAPTFAEYKARILEDYRDQQLPDMLRIKTQELASLAKTDKNLEKAAAATGAKLETSDLVDATSQVPDIGAMSGDASVAFNMQPGQISGPILGARSGAVLDILQRQAPTEQEITQHMGVAREQLLQDRREEAFAVFVTSLEQRYQKRGLIHVNAQALKSIQQPGAPS
ncbi:MAG TPA: peptidyl-prolyl cis-trans isomerase [Acidobacteriaceae bacterium]|jgi:peptidyl-prolyl cis-trans isomerase D|nr:peptidyl-prolyl cis-trans isomerase [Acidobacteriaceae bacterium]